MESGNYWLDCLCVDTRQQIILLYFDLQIYDDQYNVISTGYNHVKPDAELTGFFSAHGNVTVNNVSTKHSQLILHNNFKLNAFKI